MVSTCSEERCPGRVTAWVCLYVSVCAGARLVRVRLPIGASVCPARPARPFRVRRVAAALGVRLALYGVQCVLGWCVSRLGACACAGWPLWLCGSAGCPAARKISVH